MHYGACINSDENTYSINRRNLSMDNFDEELLREETLTMKDRVSLSPLFICQKGNLVDFSSGVFLFKVKWNKGR